MISPSIVPQIVVWLGFVAPIKKLSRTMWNWIKNNEKQIAIIFAIIGALYALCQYHQSLSKDRIINSMKYVEQLEKDKAFESSSKLTSFWLSNPGRSFIEEQKTIADASLKIASYKEKLPKLLESNNLKNETYYLLQIYRNVAFCLENEICDKTTICTFLFDDIQAFRETYRPMIEDWEINLGDKSSSSLRSIVEDKCKNQFAEYCLNTPKSFYCKKTNK